MLATDPVPSPRNTPPQRAAALRTVLRVLGVIFGGYLLTALAVAGAGAGFTWLGMARSEAVVLASMLGFVFYLVWLVWAFGLKQSMAWLHTWAGVVTSCLLFAIFWMGTLIVFDREIDRWMMPGTRLAPITQSVSLDEVARVASSVVPADAAQWRADLPTERVPVIVLSYRDGAGTIERRHIDPRSYQLIPDQGTRGAYGFFFNFHYSLHLKWLNLGEWLVGVAGMAMLVLIVSGVIIHKKIWTSFFTFRPKARLQRSALDLHNLMGVLVMPFHLMIALSGLIIFMTIFFPLAHVGVYGGGEAAKTAYTAESSGRFTRAKANAPGELSSVDAMVRQAEQRWAGGQPYFVRVWNPGDANSYVELRRSYADSITMNLDQIYFDARTGAVLHHFETAPVRTAQRVISGLHFVQFNNWTLRWLYFLAGLSGCIMIATGLVFWIEARRARHAKQGLLGVRIVEGLMVGSVTGLIAASLTFMAINRVLPLNAELAGQPREQLEMWAFWLVWLATFAHAWLRPSSAWREQIWTICALSLSCVALNALTTGDNLIHAISTSQWPIAGVDAMLLALALVSAWTAKRLARKSLQHSLSSRFSPAVPASDA